MPSFGTKNSMFWYHYHHTPIFHSQNPYAFWVVTGCMMMLCGLLWKRLLNFLFFSLNRGRLRRLPPSTKQRSKPPSTQDKS